MVDERIALLKRCTIASVRRMGLQILCSKALSRTWRGLLVESGGILIKQDGGLQWLLITRSYVVTVILFDTGKKAVI
jgi:hypothetical protein